MRILFELIGGPFDGITEEADTETASHPVPATMWYRLTHKGIVGKAFMTMSDGFREHLGTGHATDDQTCHGHRYRVTDRLEGDNEVLVRAEYFGVAE